ncbi:hypothetical protein KKF45_04070 [Patescibacteria group bacterium]|nr:hypothetical protein [Patescibacteria group bacterium]
MILRSIDFGEIAASLAGSLLATTSLLDIQKDTVDRVLRFVFTLSVHFFP